MQIIPPMERDRRLIANQGHDHVTTVPGERLIEVSSWMMVLGTIRLICTLADYAGSFLEMGRVESINFRTLSRFTHDNQPVVALCAAWPLILALALRRKRWSQLLPAAAATFLILSIGGMLELSAEWSHARGDGVTIGSLHLTGRAFMHPTFSDVSLGILGATQLLLELATAVRAILLVPRFRAAKTAGFATRDVARRARFGRLAIYTSLGYLVLMIRLPVWSTYLEVLNNSTFVREFVLRNDTKRIRSARNYVHYSKEDEHLLSNRIMLMSAHQAARDNRFATAIEAYIRVSSMPILQSQESHSPAYRATVADALNGLAWLQATCPEPSYRSSSQAVVHAQCAVEMQPNEGNYWNTLGAAYYRAADWKLAKDALSRSMKLRYGGDSFDWFFLAMVELKLGHRDQALEWYDKAVGWFHSSLPNDHELYRFHVEAAQETGFPKPLPRPSPSTTGTIVRPHPLGLSPLPSRTRSSAAVPMPRPASP